MERGPREQTAEDDRQIERILTASWPIWTWQDLDVWRVTGDMVERLLIGVEEEAHSD